MIQAVSSEIAKQGRRLGNVKNPGLLNGVPSHWQQWHTHFMGTRTEAVGERPQAYLVEMIPNATVTPHFHQVDQFQVLVAGSGTLGRKVVPPIALHYVDHHTAYGPIISGPFGLSYFTIRAKSDPGSIHLDDRGHKEFLKPTKKRYLLAESIALSTEAVLQNRSAVAIESVFEGIDDSDGLGAFILRMGAGANTKGPNPETTGGQYYIVVNGSLQFEEVSYPVWSTIYASPADAPLDVCAGSYGLEVLILNFPRSES